MKKDEITKNNRYLPKSVGVEVESCSELMVNLGTKLKQFFPTGNSESNKIYECQTVPLQTRDPLNVLLLGEVVRRCIPNYVQGGSDSASASAHCHVVGFNYPFEYAHIEALMIGLMPFLSLGWNRENFADYTFRASVVGSGPGYSKFCNASLIKDSVSYDGRNTWVRLQDFRHNSPALEVRANENSPLWLYFITPLLTNESMVDDLLALSIGDTSVKAYRESTSTSSRNSFELYTPLIEEIKQLVIPFLLKAIPSVLKNFKEHEREFMGEVLEAYLIEDEDKYNELVNTLISGDEELSEFFKLIDTEYKKEQTKFNVIKEKK